MVATWNYNREYEGIEISFDGKPSEEIRTKMKGAGFRWSSRQMKWYAKDTPQSRKVASEIATQGEDVGESLTFEQKMERDKERAEQRQERLGAKVEKLEKKSESLLDQAHKMADVIPFGQPILVGHHSEGRDRRYRDKIHDKFGKGFELQDEAKAVEQRLEGSQALARKRETPGYMSRKIDKLEADLRKFEREKERWKTQMPEWEKRTGKLKEEIAYWKKELGEVGGLKVTQADVKVGDEILYGGKWYEVVRVNPKTVTIKNWLDIPTWTWGAEYSNIKEVRHKGSPKPIYPEPEKSTTPKVHTYFFRNRPPDIGTYPEGAVMKEAWLPMRKTPKGSMAFGWVSYERELTADEIKNYELFVDLPAMPKLVAEFVKYVHDGGILEGHKEFKSEYGRAYVAWAKANNDWDSSKGDEAEFLRHLARLTGVKEESKLKSDEERFKELKDGFSSYQFNVGSPEMKELTELERKLQMKEPAKTGSLPAKNIGRSPAKIDTTSKDYQSGYNAAISGRIYPPVPAWTDQGKAEFDAGYKAGQLKLLSINQLLDKAKSVKSLEELENIGKALNPHFSEGAIALMPARPVQLEAEKIFEQKRAELKKEVLVFGQPEDTKKFVAEFGKPVEVLPEKPKVLGAPSKQELTLKEARVKAAEGKRLKGQQTLFSAVSTSTRLTQFEEKPRRAEPLKFKRPIPVVGRMRTPPYPFIRPKPKLLFAMGEEQSDIDEERQAFELARKMKAKFLEEKLKKQIKAEQE